MYIKGIPMKVINCQTLGDMCTFMLDEEPVFLIRAQDKCAREVISNYLAVTRSVGGRNSLRVEQQLDRITKWQQEHPLKVKLPD